MQTIDIINAQFEMDELAFDVGIASSGNLVQKLGYTPNTVAFQLMSDILGNVKDAKIYKDLNVPTIGGYAFGCKIFVRGKTVSMVPVAHNQWGYMNTPIGGVKCNTQYDVPLKWFSVLYVYAIKRINVVNEGWVHDWAFGWKMLAMSRDMGNYRGLIETMVQNQHTECDASCAYGKMTILEVDPSKIQGFIRVDLVNLGLYTKKFTNSVFAFTKGGSTLYSMEELNKANERVTKIGLSKGVSFGERRVFVIDKVSDPHLKNAFCTGAIMAPNSIIEQVGIARITSKKLGLKGVIMPIPFEDHLGECDYFIAASSAAKARLNGVAYAKGIDPNKQIAAGGSKIRKYLNKEIEEISFGGVTLRGWFVEDSIRITNLYALYGHSFKDEEVLDDDGNIDEVIEKGSLHQFAIHELANNKDFDVIGFLMEGINNGEILRRKDVVSLKYQDLLNVYFSYGSEVHDRLLRIAADKSVEHAPKGHTAAQRLIFKGYKDAIRLSGDDMLNVINDVWASDLDGIINNISVGKWEHHDNDASYRGREKYDFLMNGMADTNWPGFSNLDNGLVIEQGGFEFLIPSWDILKKGVFEEEDVVHFSGAWRAIFLLLIALRNENTNWALKHVQHHTDIQEEITMDVLSRMYVPGRYYVALPKWWDNKVDSVVIPGYDYRTNQRAMYSKDPVLFDSAIADVYVQKALPSCFKFNERLHFAMGDACFVHTNLLLWQQNDTDGDLVCIRRLGNIVPLYQGQMKETQKWVDKYVEGEMDLAMKYKEYKEYSITDLGFAVDHAARAKGDIGIMSSNLFLVQHLLQQAIANGVITYSDARLIKETYAVMVQEEAIKQIKAQMSTGETFFGLATLSNPWAHQKAAQIVMAFEMASNITGFAIDSEIVAKFAEFAINVLLKSNYNGFRSPNVIDTKLSGRYASAQRGNIHIFNWFQRSYFRNMHTHVPAIAHMKERDTNKMSDFQMKAYYAKKNFAENFCNKQDVQDGFWRIHGIVRKNGIVMKQEPQDISILKWMYFLSNAIASYDNDPDNNRKAKKAKKAKEVKKQEPLADNQMQQTQEERAEAAEKIQAVLNNLPAIDLPWDEEESEEYQTNLDILWVDHKPQENEGAQVVEHEVKDTTPVIVKKEKKENVVKAKKEKVVVSKSSKTKAIKVELTEEEKKAKRSEAAKKAAATRKANKEKAIKKEVKDKDGNVIDVPWDIE